jgi:hypothetical protein
LPGVSTKTDALVIDKSGVIYLAAHSTGTQTMGLHAHSSTVVKWDGSSWDTVAAWENSHLNYSYTCLTIDNYGNLYTGGWFDTIGTKIAKNVARWDGSKWAALGSGTNLSDYSSLSGGRVAALVVDGSGKLYAGGEFIIAGGKVSAYVAQCRLKSTGILPKGGEKTSVVFMTYNPRRRIIRFNLKAQARISCSIFSLSGREVFKISEFMSEGENFLRINNVLLARGAYIVQARVGKESMRFKMTVER